VFKEHTTSFSLHHGNWHNDERVLEVTRDEFLDYYAFVSVSLEDDSYFEVMMDGAWNISHLTNPYARVDTTWFEQVRPGTANSTVYQYKNIDPYATNNTHVDATMRTGLESADNPWSTTDNYYGQTSP
jgi:hypothetical protein